ncbi:MAG: acetyl-CoA hydrolase [Oscillospiraceae bacterium]|nr:acetyl-CoA hydrolase [Oscillospiraceae bacterium]
MDRIRNAKLREKVMSPEQAALLVKPGMVIGTSGFTGVGYPKAFPLALQERAEKESERFGLTLITGASVGDELDGALARSGAIARRYPYQTNPAIRNSINKGDIAYVDMHLGHVPQWIKKGLFGKIDLAVIESAGIDERGGIIPTMAVGCSDALVQCAERVVVEINLSVPMEIEGLHDIYSCESAPYTKPIPILSPGDRIGCSAIACDPEKICAIIFCWLPDGNKELAEANTEQQAIADHLIEFIKKEVAAGHLPEPLPPIQSGVGGVANAVLSGLEKSEFRDLSLYTEVMQDSVIRLMNSGKVVMASATALTVSPSMRPEMFEQLEELKGKIVLRPEEISNSAEVISRLGVIAINTAMEADLSGNVNSTHVDGVRVMNGIGGSGDFARNAGLTIFTTSSTTKNGSISCIVPQVSHVDHTEHDVDVIITEQGLADLRGLTAFERAEKMIKNCAHPKFRAGLEAYLEKVKASACAKHGLPAAWMLDPEQ